MDSGQHILGDIKVSFTLFFFRFFGWLGGKEGGEMGGREGEKEWSRGFTCLVFFCEIYGFVMLFRLFVSG